MTTKKKIIDWETYFMAVAQISAMRSKDPNTQVGCVIINNKKRIVGLGYNGMPKGNDVDFSWDKDQKENEKNKYHYVVHAEMNAILNASKLVENCDLYVTLFPCSNCSKFLVQAGVKKVFYQNDWEGEDNKIAKYILDKSKIEYFKIKNFNINLID